MWKKECCDFQKWTIYRKIIIKSFFEPWFRIDHWQFKSTRHNQRVANNKPLIFPYIISRQSSVHAFHWLCWEKSIIKFYSWSRLLLIIGCYLIHINRFNCNSCFVHEERRRVPGHLPCEEKSFMDLKRSGRPAEHLPAPKESWDFYYTDIF